MKISKFLGFESLYAPYLKQTLDYVDWGLKKQDEPDLFKSALTVLGDIGRSVCEHFTPYLYVYVPTLLNYLKVLSLSRMPISIET